MLIQMINHHLNTSQIFLKGLTTRDIVANVSTDIANAQRLFTNAKIVVPLKVLV